MNIDKAIQILKRDLIDRHPHTGPEANEAIQLGIEALQFFKGAQKAAGGYHDLRLSGETKE